MSIMVATRINVIAIGRFSIIASRTSKLYAANPATIRTPSSPVFNSDSNSPLSDLTSDTKSLLLSPVIVPVR